ncbi:MAG: histidine triad nucleotide-binding protein [Bacillota bacterium]
MAECLFCRIVNKELPSHIVYEDEDILGFRDIAPVAPVHVLFVPKRHIASLSDLTDEDGPLVGKLLQSVANYAATENSLAQGYRVVANTGPAAGQSVAHLHFHVLGGRQMGWPWG